MFCAKPAWNWIVTIGHYGNSNFLTYGNYKSESCRSTSIGCGEFTNRINRERCGARCLTHLQAWRVRILRSPPSCRHRKLPRTTQRQNNILKSMFFLEIDSRICNGSKMMENGCAWWIHLWRVKNITPYTSWDILLHDCPARPTRYAWLYARYF